MYCKHYMDIKKKNDSGMGLKRLISDTQHGFVLLPFLQLLLDKLEPGVSLKCIVEFFFLLAIFMQSQLFIVI